MIWVYFYEPKMVRPMLCIKKHRLEINIYRIYPIFGMQPLRTVKTETLSDLWLAAWLLTFNVPVIKMPSTKVFNELYV